MKRAKRIVCIHITTEYEFQSQIEDILSWIEYILVATNCWF